jgi:alpha-glucosidase
VLEIAGEFRKRDLPCDVLHLDIHHMDGYRVFTFGKSFPQPSAMMKRLAKQGFKVVAIVDPGVKNDPKFGVLRRGAKAGAFVKDPGGTKDFLGEVWPGVARFPDFLNARTRAWWGEEQQALLDAGVSGFWNDMNEPANFARPDKTLDPQCRHATDFGPRRHHQVHNLYGQQMARASREGALRSRPGERPFVITRAGYAGIQRHALVWTGDNSSHWDHLNDAVQMFLNLSLSGVPFCGGDVGGFLENTTPELFLRWFQFATFTPFFRNHTNLGTMGAREAGRGDLPPLPHPALPTAAAPLRPLRRGAGHRGAHHASAALALPERPRGSGVRRPVPAGPRSPGGAGAPAGRGRPQRLSAQ